MEYTVEEEIKDVGMKRRHVFLLGAGASRAAFPNGAKWGRKLPLMNDFVDVLGLEPILKAAGVDPPYEDFEAIYARLIDSGHRPDLVKVIESEIYNYFSSLRLPDQPTLYDHLILSLRDKDVIATFNWDPFLAQAYKRNSHITRPPYLIFLHGNVAVGYHENCRIKTDSGHACPNCGKPVADSKLLYPVTHKNYNQDTLISSEWEALKEYIEDAYMFTIFGYGAPQSDLEAVELLKKAWGSPEQRRLEQIEIIDVLDDDELANRWENIIHKDHYQTANNFFESFVAKHPRRSCEAMFAQLMNVRHLPKSEPKKCAANFDELYEQLADRLAYENAAS